MEANRGKWDQVIVDLKDIKKLYSKLEKENARELEMRARVKSLISICNIIVISSGDSSLKKVWILPFLGNCTLT